jgi:hypothetical protein
VGHPERREDVALNIVDERLAAGALDNVADEGDAVVRVGESLAGRGEAVRLIPDEKVADADGKFARFVGAEVMYLFFEAGCVGGEVAQADGRVTDAGWTGFDGEVEVLLNICVE